MDEGANQNCEECGGEGRRWFYWVNRQDRHLKSEWAFCLACFPSRDCDFAIDLAPGWDRIEANEAFDLEREGYQWMD